MFEDIVLPKGHNIAYMWDFGSNYMGGSYLHGQHLNSLSFGYGFTIEEPVTTYYGEYDLSETNIYGDVLTFELSLDNNLISSEAIPVNATVCKCDIPVPYI